MLRTLVCIPLLLSFAAAPIGASGPKTQPEIPENICPAGKARSIASAEPVLPVQDYEPSPAIWSIADEDTTIYLFGTFHLLPDGFAWRTPLFDQIVRDVDGLVVESREGPDGEMAGLDPMEMRDLIAQHRLDAPLSQRLSKHNRSKFLNLLEANDLPSEIVEYAPPMITMFGLAFNLSSGQGSQPALGVEAILEEEFRKSGRPISSIEDAMQVVENLLSIDNSLVISELDRSFDGWDGCVAADFFESDVAEWAPEHSWARGNMQNDIEDEWQSSGLGRSSYQVLIVERNAAWRDWIESRMEQSGTILLAVGAGHMEGADSLILMLEESGIAVERIQ